MWTGRKCRKVEALWAQLQGAMESPQLTSLSSSSCIGLQISRRGCAHPRVLSHHLESHPSPPPCSLPNSGHSPAHPRENRGAHHRSSWKTLLNSLSFWAFIMLLKIKLYVKTPLLKPWGNSEIPPQEFLGSKACQWPHLADDRRNSQFHTNPNSFRGQEKHCWECINTWKLV